MNLRSLNIFYQLIFLAAIFFGIGALNSVTISALGHILILIPGTYFTFHFFKKYSFAQTPRSFQLWGMLLLVNLLSVFFSWHLMKNPWHNLSKIKYFIFTYLMTFAYFFFIPYLRQKEKWTQALLYLFLISISLASLSGLIGLLTGFNPVKMKAACHLERNCGMFGMPITYGYTVGLITVLLSGLLIYRNKLKHLVTDKLLIGTLTISLVGLYFSYTRGAALGVLLSTPFYFFKQFKNLFWKLILTSCLTIILGFTFSSKIRDLFLSGARIESNMQRISLYKAAIYGFLERPLTGYGYKNFEDHSLSIKRRNGMDIDDTFAGEAHNNLLDQLATTGIIGIVILLFFFITWLRESYTNTNFFSELMFPIVIYIFFVGQFESTLSDAENLFIITNLYSLYAASLMHKRLDAQIKIENN